MNGRNLIGELKRRKVVNVIARGFLPALAGRKLELRSGRERVHDFDEREAVKIAITRHNPANAVFSHEDRGVGVVQNVPAQMRKLAQSLAQDLGMPAPGEKERDGRRGENGLQKLPRAGERPGFVKNLRMGAHAQEFVADAPSEKPRRTLPAPLLEQAPAGAMKLGVLIGRVNQHVGIGDKHLSLIHRLEERVAVRDVDPVAAAAQFRQGWELRRRSGATRLEEQSQTRFDQFGHRALPPRGFPAESRHDRVVDVQGRLHMGNHISYMAMRQRRSQPASPS